MKENARRGEITVSKLVLILILLGAGYFIWKAYITPYSKLLSFQSFLSREADKAQESTDYEISERILKEAKALGFIISPEDIKIDRKPERVTITVTLFYETKVWKYVRSMKKELMAVGSTVE